MKCEQIRRIGYINATLMLLISGLIIQVAAAVSVKMFSRDESLGEVNISKPRIYLENTGTEALSGIIYYYYFTTENGAVPVWDDYYTPSEDVIIEPLGNDNYRLKYTVTSTVNPGVIVPDLSGNVLGLHYNDWSNWGKTNDYSNNGLNSFAENNKIVVYHNATLVYGIEPSYGGDPGDPPVPPSDEPFNMKLLSFALYSTQQTVVKDRSVFSGGGAVGSNGFVQIGLDAVVSGNIVSGGNSTLLDRSTINGDVILGGTLTRATGVSIRGTISEGVSVGTLALPQYSITPGTNNITVNQWETRDLAPGFYGNISVLQNGILNLVPGNYVFKNFSISNDADIVLNASMQELITIDIDGNLELADRAEMKFKNFSYAPAVRIHCSKQNTFHIGCDSKIAGIYTAPQTTVKMFSRAQCDGAIYAKEIIIEPDAVISSGMVNPEGDPDKDGVPTGIEVLPDFRTDPDDPSSYPMVAIPNPLIIDNSVKTTVMYNYTVFFSNYTSADSVVIIYPANSLVNPVMPLIPVMLNQPSTIPPFSNDDFIPVGQYLELKGNTIQDGQTVITGLALDDDVIPADYKLAVWDDSISAWVIETPGSQSQGIDAEDYEAVRMCNAMPCSFSKKRRAAIVVKERIASLVAYFDDGTVFSTSPVVELSTKIKILHNGEVTILDAGYINVDCVKKSTGELKIETMYLFNIDNKLIYNGDCVRTYDDDIDVTQLRIRINTSPITNVTIPVNCTVKKGEKFCINASVPITEINRSPKYNFTKSQNIVLESTPIAGDGLAQRDGISNSRYNYSYFLKDHLGSTRMVLGAQSAGGCQINRAMMYQAYGSVSEVGEVGATSTDPLRQKFTTKELEMAKKETGITIVVAVTNVPPVFEPVSNCKPYIKFNFIDGSHHIVDIVLSSYGGLNVLKECYFDDEKTITSIELHAEGTTPEKSIHYIVNSLNQTAHIGKKLAISLVDWNTIALMGSNPANHYSFYEWDAPELVSEGVYYFGARFHAPEIGMFLSTDPADEQWNAYAYCAGDPINLTDPTGAIIEGLGPVFTNAANASWFIQLSEQAPWLAEMMWNSSMTFGPTALSSVLTGLNVATAVGQTILESAIAWGDVANNLSSNINATASFAIANTVGRVPEQAWNVLDDIGDAAMALEGAGAIPKGIATLGRGARVLGEGSVVAKNGAVVIGEGMGPIKTAAQGLRAEGVNAKWYQAWSKNFPKDRLMTPSELNAAKLRNARWIKSQIKSGKQIYDIGIDADRLTRSPFYQLEQDILTKYNYPTIPLAR